MLSYKIRLDLNNKQATLAKKHAGVARHAYNWGLAQCQVAHQNKVKHPSAIDLHKRLNAEVKTVHKWYYEVSKCAPQEALRNVERAYKRFFQKKSDFPKFKKKGRRDSFYLDGSIELRAKKIKLPHFGWLRLSETIAKDKNGRYPVIKNVTVSCRAGHWFVSFKTDTTPTLPAKHPKKPATGVDLGIKTLATLSTGEVFANLRPYKKYKRKLKLAQRKASKKYKKGAKEQSKNYKKEQLKVANIHYKIACIRQDALHKLTTHLAQNHSEVVIEDLNVQGMTKNHKLASAILDGGFYEFKRQLTYKCEWYKTTLTLAPRFYASSKLCSSCGEKKEDLTLKDRIYHCEKCGLETDRDLNASLNLEKLAVSYTVSACGASRKPVPNGAGRLRNKK